MSEVKTKGVSTSSSRRLPGAVGAVAVLSSLALLAGCAQPSAPEAAADCAETTVGVQSWNVGASGAEDPMNVVAEMYQEETGNKIEVNSVQVEIFRSQLPTYVSSTNPPDAIKWLAGATTRQYADDGLLLDVSDVWAESMTDFPDSLKALSTDASGKQYMVPTDYYWWGIFYRPSLFEEKGYTVPETWDDFVALAKKMESDKLIPIAIGTSGAEWVATGWFDYLNLRINGVDFHRELLQGKHDFTGPEVRKVFEKWAEVQPYFDKNGTGQTWQDGLNPLFNKEAGMTLIGGFLPIPEDIKDDVDFFAFPNVDPNVPRVEEAPTDGFFIPANTENPECAKKLLTYLSTAEAQMAFIKNSGSRIAGNLTVPDDFYSDLTRKGRDHLAGAADLTQFYNRDSSEEFSVPATAAHARFLAQGTDSLEEILAEWDAASKRVIEEQSK